MKKYIGIIILNLIFVRGVAQNWTWMKGSNTINQFAVYGTKNIASSIVTPGSRGGAFCWKDNTNNLWLFGGNGYALSTSGKNNDLFKYDLTTNNWTWVNGDQLVDQPGIYGTLGISSPSNKPGSRMYGASWVDKNGNFWLFGGRGFDAFNNLGVLNDLWKYDPLINEWTWMKGSNTINQYGIYGTLGVSNNLNCPGGRISCCTWVDGFGDFWFFGGDGYATLNSNGYLNDLWKFNIATNEWTWMKGDSLANSAGNQGTLGLFGVANAPCSRTGSVSWIDTFGKLWLFGGFGYNDMWTYDPIINQWAWMKGSQFGQVGNYGIINIPSSTNNPGSRSVSDVWKDTSGNLWLFGGYGYDYSGCCWYMNDLWEFNPLTNEWIWQKGPNQNAQPGIYGTQTVSNPLNTPGARSLSATWVDNLGNFWLFGGEYNWGMNLHNDLWKFSNPLITRINTMKENIIQISPNPASEFVFVKKGIKQTIAYFLVDLDGKQIQSGNIFDDFHQINLEKLSSGTYVLRLISDSDVITQKIIVSK